MTIRGRCVLLFVIVLLAFGTLLYGQSSCGVTDYQYGYPTSVVSQSKQNRDSSYWLFYSGSNTQNLKFTMKFPSAPATKNVVQKLSFNPQQSYAWIPFNYHWNDTDSPSGGLGQLTVANDTNTCKSSVYFADNGFESTNVPKAIPEFGVGPLMQSGIVVKNVDYITKVRVSVYLTHPVDGDLEIYLNGPTGASALLSYRNGGSGDNYGSGFAPNQRTTFDEAATTPITSASPPFIGTFAPQGSLSIFNGMYGAQANGLWSLQVIDDAAGNTGQVINWALMIDDVSGTRVTWASTCLNKEMFIAAGYTPNATEQSKLTTNCYTLIGIVSGWTDRLVDNNFCTNCHTGGAGNPNRYMPDYGQWMLPMAVQYQTTFMNSTYAWGDPTANGIIYHFKTNPNIVKPAGLKAIFQKWLDDGAHL
jgi:subtilisin-like proprotein convertase family protein